MYRILQIFPSILIYFWEEKGKSQMETLESVICIYEQQAMQTVPVFSCYANSTRSSGFFFMY